MSISAPKPKIQYVYPFGANFPTPPLDKNLLGGKGKGLAEMASLGLPVPPGFIITTQACNDFKHEHRHLPAGLEDEVCQTMHQLEEQTGREFGSETNPLLVSVRSGARASMPGMMDTILNLGLNDRSVLGLAERTNNERFAYDSYRRFIMMYADIVANVDREHFVHAFDVLKMQQGVKSDLEVSAENIKESCSLFKKIYLEHTGKEFPQDAQEQLFDAICAVFNSWDCERAILYRQLNHIPDEWGTAVNIVTMVFGNKNDNSATGVGFTRDPATGDNHFYGEFLLNAQGEEVVAGIRTPHPINNNQKKISKSSLASLEEMMPEAYQELNEIVHKLEKHYGDMQDIEFTIEDGKLYMLQTRTGKRTGFAAVKIAMDMLNKGLLNEQEALMRIDPTQITQLLTPIFDREAKRRAKSKMVAKGLNAGPGAATGQAAFTTERAVEMKKQGIHCILVRVEANPDDFPGMVAAQGVLTIRGGSTSHAAVVARGMGKPCVVGCGELTLNQSKKILTAGSNTLKEGDAISIDGSTGEVFFCEVPTTPSEVLQVIVNKSIKPEESQLYQYYDQMITIANKYRTMEVRANADTPLDSVTARALGGEGIGLCRTEHMFLELTRLNDVRCMLFSTREEERKQAIQRLLPYQKQDFIGIFEAMRGLPVTIRLLDPPLHEFMPHGDDELNTLADKMGVSRQKLGEIRASMEEQNPMLGHRGCRLGITYPELTEMQTRAIIEAALEVQDVIPEIMVPLIGSPEELQHQKMLIEKTIQAVFEEKKRSIKYMIGTMIELPRSAILAYDIARFADFFSFGTNDLTQTTFGISRDDSAKFVPTYVAGIPNPSDPEELMHIMTDDPFQVLDQKGVGSLMINAIKEGRKAHPHLECGICGEHAGEPTSIAFCHKIGIDYLSCSTYRIPVAIVAAAQAKINENFK